MITSGFDEHVGISAYNGTYNIYVSEYFCHCKDGFFGPLCDKTFDDFQAVADCNDNGVFDSRNTVTGCTCRTSINGTATEYHGWYCERHNR